MLSLSWLSHQWHNEQNAVLCHACSRRAKLNIKSLCQQPETAVSVEGLTNWRDPSRSFTKHESSAQHKESVLMWTSHCSRSVAAEECNEQRRNWEILMKILSPVKWFAIDKLRGERLTRTGNISRLQQPHRHWGSTYENSTPAGRWIARIHVAWQAVTRKILVTS